MIKKISSNQNPLIKFALSLQKSSVRKNEGLFLIEGIREIRLAMLAGYQFHTLFVPTSVIENVTESIPADYPKIYSRAKDIVDILTGQAQIIETSRDVFRKLTYREGSEGLLAIARQEKLSFKDLSLSVNPLVLVAESVEKPGNLGAILRTADAAGVDAVLVCDSGTDIFNPNVVRSSLGTLFTLQVVCCSPEEAISWLKEMNIKIYTTALSDSEPYHLIDYLGATAFVAGAEATGVSSAWKENSNANIIIPMFGKVDSMNVSVATSIVLYEALRQRGFPERDQK